MRENNIIIKPDIYVILRACYNLNLVLETCQVLFAMLQKARSNVILEELNQKTSVFFLRRDFDEPLSSLIND